MTNQIAAVEEIQCPDLKPIGTVRVLSKEEQEYVDKRDYVKVTSVDLKTKEISELWAKYCQMDWGEMEFRNRLKNIRMFVNYEYCGLSQVSAKIRVGHYKPPADVVEKIYQLQEMMYLLMKKVEEFEMDRELKALHDDRS